ncbi:IKI3 family-domain-containing protein [Kickxella alabastrina]|uniref:IKI3 family-domain-containing protein n=2 Tax=Kickxella alabastrina TaxID=61397 RepID=UPI00221F1443|nr:IKI3 family-domain-containing protein [Kickxella alabastrina]KAI7821425.1 IKI3 family-domain-containing protein [Kickxella alabastrina]
MRNLSIQSEIVVSLPGYRVLGGWDHSSSSSNSDSFEQRDSPAAALCVDVTEQKAYVLLSIPLGSLTTAAAAAAAEPVCVLPFSASDAQIAGMQYLMERESVVVVLRSGDIYTIGVATGDIEAVGTVDPGIVSSAWSPDEEVLALDFDVLAEFLLAQGEQGEEQHVALGWGRKETQYHGKAGKQAALADSAVAAELSRDDDYCVRVAWRGDGAFFGVTFVRGGRREIRVFSREGALHSTAERIQALEHPLAWKPAGRLLAATERLAHRHDVVFYERNGLRHGEFTLRECTRRVVDLAWNSDSSVLAVTALVDCGSGGALEPCVELWADRNYHWYLKQELRASAVGGDISHVVWDAEDALCLHVVGRAAYAPWSNVPPPMALNSLDAGTAVAHVAFAAFGCGNSFAALLADRRTAVLFSAEEAADSVRSVRAPAEQARVLMVPGVVVRQIAWPSAHTVRRRGGGSYRQVVSVADVDTGSTRVYYVDELLGCDAEPVCLKAAPHAQALLLETADSQVHALVLSGSAVRAKRLAQLPATCIDIDAVLVDGAVVVIGRTQRNQLSVCSSFYLRRDMLLFTTTTHFVRFVPVDSGILTAAPSEEEALVAAKYDESCRRVERGSTIVVASPVGESVVFQMPRGNLETVRPRALVLTSVRRALDDRRYRDALLACRVSRIDMNILYDHNADQLSADFAEFVAQINDPDLLNLFVSGLRDENVTRTMYKGINGVSLDHQQQQQRSASVEGKATRVCQTLRPVLQATGDARFMPTVLTTFVCQSPADIPAALQLLAPLSAEERDSALTYLLFLSDVNTVYDAALGLYDLPLALLVAQRSQRDPREYLNALGALNALPNEEYRRFKIDAQLERGIKALGHLCTAYEQIGTTADKEAEMWAEIVAYVKQTVLYQRAISILSASKNQRRFRDMCELYGDHQAEANTSEQWRQAAMSYELAGVHAKAANAFVQAKQWQLAMATASAPGSGLTLQMVHDTAVRASEVLAEHHLFRDAAAVLLEYTEKDEDALALLVRGGHWAEAMRNALSRERSDLVETTVRPGLTRACETLGDDLDEIREALASKCARLREVRSTPLEMIVDQILAMANNDGSCSGPLPDNIDVMSDTTSMASRFSSFTATETNASSRMTGSTARRISKNRKKEEKRKVRGKKGSIYEESYLVDSISKLVDRVRVHQTAVREIIWALVHFGQLTVASQMQSSFAELVDHVLAEAAYVFDEQRVQMRLGENGLPEPVPMEVNEFGMTSQPKHPKPILPSYSWKIDSLNLASK